MNAQIVNDIRRLPPGSLNPGNCADFFFFYLQLWSLAIVPHYKAEFANKPEWSIKGRCLLKDLLHDGLWSSPVS